MRKEKMQKHQWAAIIMAAIVIMVSFIPVFVYGAFSDKYFTFLRYWGWMYPLIGTGIAAVLVVAAFWPMKKD